VKKPWGSGRGEDEACEATGLSSLPSQNQRNVMMSGWKWDACTVKVMVSRRRRMDHMSDQRCPSTQRSLTPGGNHVWTVAQTMYAIRHVYLEISERYQTTIPDQRSYPVSIKSQTNESNTSLSLWRTRVEAILAK
jgi:hypothetical protein